MPIERDSTDLQTELDLIADDEVLESGESTESKIDPIDELAAVQGDLTAEQLRKLPGAEGLTDEQLLAAWKEANQPPKPRSYKLYGQDDKEVLDLDKLTAAQLLELKVGYTAMGKEQKRSFDELVRNASLGHYNESKMLALKSERDSTHAKLLEVTKQNEEWANDRQLWEHALTAATQGNLEPLKALIEAFAAISAAPPSLTGSQPAAGTSEPELEAAGQRVYYEVVLPTSYQLAKDYGADAQEIAAAIMYLVDQEPTEFMTPEKFQAIMNVELPHLLEQNGYSRALPTTEAAPGQPRLPNGQFAPTNQPNAELDSLKAQVAELTAKLENKTTQNLRNRKVPPVGGGTVPPNSETQPDFKDKFAMKEYLQA